MVVCDICGEEIMTSIGRYWKPNLVDTKEGLLLTVCEKCDTQEKVRERLKIWLSKQPSP